MSIELLIVIIAIAYVILALTITTRDDTYNHVSDDIRCFHCGGKVIWQRDFSFEDYCLEGDGIVHICQCSKCGAMIEYYVPLDEENENFLLSHKENLQ